MALIDIQRRITSLADESRTIAAKADLGDADLTRIEEISAEGQKLQRQMDALKTVGDFSEWAGKSAGMLPLTGGGQSGVVTVHGMTPAGATTIEAAKGGWLVNSEGEGVLDDATMKTLRNPDYSRAFKAYLRRGIGKMTEATGLKLLQEGIDTSGGFLVPEDLLNTIIAKEPAATSVSGRLRRFTTSRDSVLIPKVNYTTDDIYTTGMRVTWTGEVPASSTAHRVTEPVFGQTRIPIFTAMMSLPLTIDMVEDSAFDVTAWITGKFTETIALLRDNMALNGTGAGQPFGILANPNATDNPATVATGVSAAITWDGLQNLVWALPDQYDGNACHVFNKASTGLAISKLVDGDGRPLWTVGSADTGLVGSPKQRTLLGYDVIYSAFMPNVGASTYPIIFGDLRGYYAVDRVGMAIQVLRERYAEENQIVVLGRVRFGGLVAEPWRLKICVAST